MVFHCPFQVSTRTTHIQAANKLSNLWATSTNPTFLDGKARNDLHLD